MKNSEPTTASALRDGFAGQIAEYREERLLRIAVAGTIYLYTLPMYTHILLSLLRFIILPLPLSVLFSIRCNPTPITRMELTMALQKK